MSVYMTKTKGMRFSDRGAKARNATPDEVAHYLVNRLLEINMVLARLVEHLDQVDAQSAKAMHDAIQDCVRTWTKKALA